MCLIKSSRNQHLHVEGSFIVRTKTTSSRQFLRKIEKGQNTRDARDQEDKREESDSKNLIFGTSFMSRVIRSLSYFSLFIVVFELTDLIKRRGRRERGKRKYCGIIYNFIQFVIFPHPLLIYMVKTTRRWLHVLKYTSNPLSPIIGAYFT